MLVIAWTEKTKLHDTEGYLYEAHSDLTKILLCRTLINMNLLTFVLLKVYIFSGSGYKLGENKQKTHKQKTNKTMTVRIARSGSSIFKSIGRKIYNHFIETNKI